MHELAIAQSVVEIASRHAAGGQVTRVELKIGYLRQVVPSALLFSFELVAQGTPIEGAELTMEMVPAVGICRVCAVTSQLEEFPLCCTRCGGVDLEIVSGNELTVESLEIEEATDGTLAHQGGGRGRGA